MTIDPNANIVNESAEPRNATSGRDDRARDSAFSECVIAPDCADPEAVARAIAAVGRSANGNDAIRGSISIRKQREQRHTTHFWVEVGSAPHPRRFFVKRYRPPLERNLFTFALPSRVEREYANSRRALELGIPSLPAVGFAQRRRFGFVVDQVIAFEDAGKCKSSAQLLELAMERGEEDPTRSEIAARLADDLRAMHERGYSHLSMSPRNYLKVLAQDRFVFIDHNASLVYSRSIHARDEAVPDLLNLLESRRMFPDAASQREFLLRYAPDAADFRARVSTAIGSGTRSDRAARIQKVKHAFSRGRI